MARKTGISYATIASWLRRKAIPDRYKPVILERAIELDIAIGPEDFFPSQSESDGLFYHRDHGLNADGRARSGVCDKTPS